MDALSQTLRSLGPVRLAAIGAVAIGLIAFFAFVTTRLSTADMMLLYSDLDLADSGEIASRLEALDIPYQIRGNGGAIMVPGDQVDRARLLIAQEGLPKGGSLGYEIFDRAEGFGSSDFVQNINRLRALEGELARTIGTIASVRQARVHLVLPERELFSRDRQESSASVFLRLRGSVSRQQVAAIQHLIAAAVPSLQPQNVSIVDDRGTLLARGGEAGSGILGLSSAEELRRNYEMQLSQSLEDLLSRTVGPGNVRAQVSADMDFDRITTTEELFDPNSQVARSTQLMEESSESSEDDGSDAVTVGNTLPEAGALAPLGGASASNRSETLQETVNYEISRTVLNTVRDSGNVRRLSVAVLIDGTYDGPADGEGEPVYQPRSAEEIAQIDALVRSAIGFNAERGDTVEIINMPFVTADDLPIADDEGVVLGLDRHDILRIAELLVMAVVAGLVILLVVRPLLNRIMDLGDGGGATGDGYEALLPAGGGLPRAIAGPSDHALPDAAELEMIETGTSVPATMADGGNRESAINIDRVDGRVRESSVKKIGEIVEKHPDESISIIRNWMYQET